MKRNIISLIVFLICSIATHAQNASTIEILDDLIKISAGKVYYNNKEIITTDQVSTLANANIEDIKLKDRSTDSPISLTNFYEILGTNSAWKAFVGSATTNKPEGLPTGTYRIISFGSNGQSGSSQQGVAIAVKGTNGEPYMISRDENSVLKATPMIPKPLDYSNSEQKTGQKWIDGKEVYQRTLTGTVTGWTNQHFNVPFTKTGIIIKFEGFLYSQSEVIPFNGSNNDKSWGNETNNGRYSCWYDLDGNYSGGTSGFDIKDMDNLNRTNHFQYIIHVYYTKQ